MTDKEKKLIVDAIVKIADITSTYDTDHEGEVDAGVSEQIGPVTKKLCADLGITEEMGVGLIKLIHKNNAELLTALLKKALDSVNDDEEDDDDDDEEGEE